MKYLVYGSKNFAQLIADFLITNNMDFSGFIDDFAEISENIVGSFDIVRQKFSKYEYQIVLGLGYNDLKARLRIFNKIKKHGYTLPKLIHPRAYVNNHAIIGEGSILMVNSVVDYKTQIGPICVLWPNAVVNHDCNIGANCFLSPNSNICGFVSVGKNCFIGASATVINHNHIPDNSFIKSGSVINKSL